MDPEMEKAVSLMWAALSATAIAIFVLSGDWSAPVAAVLCAVELVRAVRMAQHVA